MIKRINQYLLLYFPLVWNTHAFWMLVSLLTLHLTFYLTGWFNFDSYLKLQGYIGDSTFLINGTNPAYATIISILLLIVWLVFYLRNNPFKSFYPLPKGYFALEYCIIFLVMVGCLTLPKSFARGFYDAIEFDSRKVNLTEEINTLNVAYALIPERDYDYRAYNCCDSLEYRETKAYKEMRERMDSIETAQENAYRDSIDSLDAEDLPQVTTRHKKKEIDEEYSYLNFCKQYAGFYDSAAMDRRHVSEKLQLLLTANDKAGAAAILERFEKMCKRYKVGYNLNMAVGVSRAFKDQKHTANVFLENSVNRTSTDGYEPKTELKTEYVDFEGMQNVLHKIYQSRHREFDGQAWALIAYLALFMALGLFSFRLSSTRVWLIALVGAGVICIIYAIVAALIRNEYFVVITAMSFIALFYIGFRIMLSARRKTLAGVSLVWFSWSYPASFMLIHAFLSDLTKPITRYDPVTFKYITGPTPPLHDFLEDHTFALITIYFALTFISIITLLYRHFRTWQAMDEE